MINYDDVLNLNQIQQNQVMPKPKQTNTMYYNIYLQQITSFIHNEHLTLLCVKLTAAD